MKHLLFILVIVGAVGAGCVSTPKQSAFYGIKVEIRSIDMPNIGQGSENAHVSLDCTLINENNETLKVSMVELSGSFHHLVLVPLKSFDFWEISRIGIGTEVYFDLKPSMLMPPKTRTNMFIRVLTSERMVCLVNANLIDKTPTPVSPSEYYYSICDLIRLESNGIQRQGVLHGAGKLTIKSASVSHLNN